MLWEDRIPFDSLWRKDLKDCRLILRKDGKIYAGAFYYRETLEPVIDAMNLMGRPDNPVAKVRKYKASWSEIVYVFTWFKEWFDLDALKAKAEANDAIAQRLLGFIYANAWTSASSYDTREADDKVAFYWLKRSAD